MNELDIDDVYANTPAAKEREIRRNDQEIKTRLPLEEYSLIDLDTLQRLACVAAIENSKRNNSVVEMLATYMQKNSLAEAEANDLDHQLRDLKITHAGETAGLEKMRERAARLSANLSYTGPHKPSDHLAYEKELAYYTAHIANIEASCNERARQIAELTMRLDVIYKAKNLHETFNQYSNMK